MLPGQHRLLPATVYPPRLHVVSCELAPSLHRHVTLPPFFSFMSRHSQAPNPCRLFDSLYNSIPKYCCTEDKMCWVRDFFLELYPRHRFLSPTRALLEILVRTASYEGRGFREVNDAKTCCRSFATCRRSQLIFSFS